MSKHLGGGKFGSAARAKRAKKSISTHARRLGFECLEQRQLLSSIGLSAISNVTVPAGNSVLVALNGSDPGQTIDFGATATDPTQVTPIVMPQTNKSVQFTVDGSGISGTMTFQLFDNLTPTTANHIETLVNDGFYNGDYIYRAQSGFVVQGGNDPPQINNGNGVNTLPSGVPATIDEEFNPDLNYSTAGDLAMARTGSPNSSGTEFFITEAAAQNPLDYSYTLFGFQTVDPTITVNGTQETILRAIQAEPTETSSGFSYLDTPIEITQAKIITDTQNGVLMLRTPAGATVGSTYTVSVTASDGTNTPATQTFTVTVGAATNDGNVVNPWASDTPAAPASVAFQPLSGQGTTTTTSANNSSPSQELQFLVSGVTVGDQVTVYADGVVIGSVNATSTSQLVSTDGTTALLNGTHTITATQTAVGVSEIDSGDSSQNETANVDSLSSPGIQLQVDASLTVTTSPTSQTVAVGGTASFTAAASSDLTPIVHWEVNTGSGYTSVTNGGVYSGSGTDTLTITGATVAMSGYQYEAVFSNTAGDATSAAATLTVQTAPSVTTSPTSQTVAAGGTASFSAAAGGSPPPSVQWEVNTGSGYSNVTDGGVYSGSNTGTLSITAATAAMSGYQYQAVFSNAAGYATTTAATLTVQSAPSVTTNPTSRTTVAGGTAAFTAAASGDPTPTVQWEVNTGSGYSNVTDGGVYSGSTTGTLTITAATAAMSGYQYEAVFSNGVGTPATTAAATLTIQVATAPSVTAIPTSQTVVAGGTATFTAAAGGSPTPGVQWEVNTGSGYSNVTDGGVYSGSTTGTLTITGATSAMSGYQYEAVFSNGVGTPATTTAAMLTVQTAPSVTTSPTSQTVTLGGTASFTAAASGSPTPSVQWQVNTGSGYSNVTDGGVYSGSGTDTLTITAATAAMSGYQYEAIFSNAAGNATTTAATLTVQIAPSVTTNPTSQTVMAGGTGTFGTSGGTTTFTAAASGSPAPSVQWEVNTGSGYANVTDGGVYSGSSTDTLTITGATAAMSGYQYQAVFSNAAGNATTAAATLTVQAPTTGTISGFVYLNGVGYAGIPLQLQSVDSQGNLSDVAGAGTVQTLSDGSYSFSGLDAGTYQVQISPSLASQLDVSSGETITVTGGQGSASDQVAVTAGQNSGGNSFTILGQSNGGISLRDYMNATGTRAQFVANALAPVDQSTPSVTVKPAVTVNSLTTNAGTPTLTGTVAVGSTGSGIASVTVTVDGQDRTATVSGTTWSAALTTALADGTYNVQVTALDNAGNSTTIPGTGDLVVDTVPPTLTVTSLTTANTTPTLTGTVNDVSPSSGIASVTLVVDGQDETATVSGTTWSASLTTALAAGMYNVQVTALDNAGNSTTIPGTGALVISPD